MSSAYAGKYALDIVKLNAWGFRAKGFIPLKLDAYDIFGDKLFAPCSGEIILVENEINDNIPFQMNSENPMGNHVVLYCEGYSVLMAHLKKNSVDVSLGSYVKEGDFVGVVGNSGNSSEPHLHIHVVKGSVSNHTDIIEKSMGIPMIFNNRFLVRGDRFKSSNKK